MEVAKREEVGWADARSRRAGPRGAPLREKRRVRLFTGREKGSRATLEND
ncbi:hypothetical protein [Streptomyces sp. CC219B]|nr:hypothetical protein [Streptomyces sp. CC219B]